MSSVQNATNKLINPNKLINQPNQFNRVPIEIITFILSFLSVKDLGRAVVTCKQWKNIKEKNTFLNEKLLEASIQAKVQAKAVIIAEFLKKKHPLLKIIDATTWEKYVDLKSLQMKIQIPAITEKDISKILTKMFRTLKIEGAAGISLITIPQNMTLNKLVKIAQEPKTGNKTDCRFISPEIVQKYGDNPTTTTKVYAVTNSVLQKSKDLSLKERKKLLKSSNCELTDFIVIVALSIMTHISSSQSPPLSLFSYKPYLYTHCKDNIEVGGYTPNGLRVSLGEEEKNIFTGVAVMHSFVPSKKKH